MYRFLLFTYAEYYPNGGTNDLYFKFNDFAELINEIDDVYLSEDIEIYDTKYDYVLYIKDSNTLLKEFREYLG